MKYSFTRIQRYIFWHFVKALIGALVLFIGIFIIIKLIEQLGAFMANSDRVPFHNFILYFVYEIPNTLTYLFPISCLFSIVYTLGRLNAHNELIAIYNSGTSIFYTVVPIIILIFILCFLMFNYDKEFIYDNHERHRLINKLIHRRTDYHQADRKDITVFGKNNKIYFIKRYQPKNNLMHNVHILFLDNALNFSRMISAQQLTYDLAHHAWLASNAVLRTWSSYAQQHLNTTNSKAYILTNVAHRKAVAKSIPKVENHTELLVDLDETPFHFERKRAAIEHLSAEEVLQLAKKYEIIGGEYKKYYSYYYNKTATPFIPIVILLLGIPLSVFSRRAILPLSFFLVLVTSFIFIIVSYIGTSLGANGVLPPFIAGWFGNLSFLIIALYLYKKFAL